MSARNKRIKWVNKFSKEEGFVKSISRTKGYFENTFNYDEAKHFSDVEANKALKILVDIGEADNNDFVIVSA